MKIKHSKYRNTGLLYELLVRRIASDLVSRKESPAVNILRKYFTGNTALVQEYRLYKAIGESTKLDSTKADHLLNEIRGVGIKLNLVELKAQKYRLISEIKSNYDLDEFFGVTVPNYRTLAAIYCILEADRSSEIVDPESIVSNKITLLESMTGKFLVKENVTSVFDEFSNCDRSVRLLTFKILLERFNKEYGCLLTEQKQLLKQIMSLGTTRGFKGFLNEEINKLNTELTELVSKFPKGIERIKLQEALKILKPLEDSEKVEDSMVVKVLQFYDLKEELKKVV